MRIQRKPTKAPALALTSMLDVIFLLLCFFVTVSVYSQWENEITIALPKAENAEQPQRLPGEIVVNLSAEGRISVNGRSLTEQGLTEKLSKVAQFYPGQPIIIRADRAVEYELLVDLIDACRAAGVWNFSLATAAEGDGR